MDISTGDFDLFDRRQNYALRDSQGDILVEDMTSLNEGAWSAGFEAICKQLNKISLDSRTLSRYNTSRKLNLNGDEFLDYYQEQKYDDYLKVISALDLLTEELKKYFVGQTQKEINIATEMLLDKTPRMSIAEKGRTVLYIQRASQFISQCGNEFAIDEKRNQLFDLAKFAVSERHELAEREMLYEAANRHRMEKASKQTAKVKSELMVEVTYNQIKRHDLGDTYKGRREAKEAKESMTA